MPSADWHTQFAHDFKSSMISSDRSSRVAAWIVFVLLVVGVGTVAAAQAENKPCANGFNPQPWIDDFAQLRAEMSAHYANLESAVQDRRMDLPALRIETEGKISHSCDASEAHKAVEAFLSQFGDGHMFVEWPDPASTTETKPAETGSLCTRLGYKKFGIKPGVDFSFFPQFTALAGADADWFPGGILRVGDTVKLGVLRMPIFSEHAYPDACEQTAQEMHLKDSDKCDDKCEDALEIATANRLTAAVVRRLKQLQAAGATAILADITRNGGGSNWVEPLPRILSPVPLREERFGILKHEHWTKQLKEQLDEVEADLKKGKGPKDVLEEVAARLHTAITHAQEPCDRSEVWTDNKFPCSLLITDVLTNGGLLPYAAPGSFASLDSKAALFHPLNYVYTESMNRLPLYVAVDYATGSAAEYFPSVLQDNGAAKIFGEATGGAGCGYTDEGIPTVLKNSQAKVKMPDCVRFRKNGMDEVQGVTPDVLVPWSRHDSPYMKARKLYDVLLVSVSQESKESGHGVH